MTPRLTWLAVILVPMVASCSSLTGITKKTAEVDDQPKPKVESKAKEPETAQAQAPQEGAFHIVGTGETLRHICDVYSLDLKKVAAINKIEPQAPLKAGDTIFLPADALVAAKTWVPEPATAKAPGKRLKITEVDKYVDNVAKAIRGKRHPLVPELAFPVPSGVLTSPFGYRWGVFHKGLDIAAPVGTPVLACADGRVIFTGRRQKLQNYGKIVLIQHASGVYTTYAHLNRTLVTRSQKVKRGQQIATVGNTGRSTGPHLHLEVRVKSQMYNPLAYFTPKDLKNTRIAKKFSASPMGPVPAQWDLPLLLGPGH
jgi:murein DD-endopeptidase MepM/ murein hydrolase activator NlpD